MKDWRPGATSLRLFSRTISHHVPALLVVTVGRLPQCGMTRTPSTGLIIAGIIMLIGGGIGAIIAKNAADSQATIDQFVASFDNQLIDFTPDYTGMWILVVVAAIGAVSLIAGLAIRPKDHMIAKEENV